MKKPGKLAITGIDVRWGGCRNAVDFERHIYEGVAYQPEFDQQSVESGGAHPGGMSVLAQRALEDGGIAAHIESRHLRIGLAAFNGKPDPGTRPQPIPGWPGPFRDLSTHPLPIVGALHLAGEWLAAGDMDAVVIASVSFADNSAEPGQAAVFGFDRSARSLPNGKGAGAVVLMDAERALAEGRRIYAIIESIAYRPGQSSDGEISAGVLAPALEDVRSSCQEAVETTGRPFSQIGYVETFACGIDAVDGIEIAGLVQSYRTPEPDLTAAVGSAQFNTGLLGAATGLAMVVRAALCLYYRSIPGTPGWHGPKLPALWRGAPFYVPEESRPWLQPAAGPARLAACNLIGYSKACAHLILSEPWEQPVRSSSVMANSGFFLFPLVGSGELDMSSRFAQLRQDIQNGMGLSELAAEYYERVQSQGNDPYAAAIVGHNRDEILREVDLALKALPDAFTKKGDWQTPLGSYMTTSPAGALGGVAFVYPGAFNSYPGVGKDLFRLFPGLFQRTNQLTMDQGGLLRERLLFPRSLNPISKEELAGLETQLLADPISMLITGTALSVLFTHILRETFGIHADAAFGYSLGENSMMYATGVWFSHGDQAASRLENSKAFRVRLAGPQEAIREYWKLPALEGEPEQPLWSNYLVMAAPEKVRAVLTKEKQVYITHINTPRQVVIGGDPAACQRVLSELGCSSLKAPFDYALHCEVMASEYPELARLHDYPIENQNGLKLYSASDYAPIQLDQAEIAHKVAHMLITPLDFPRLVRTVYGDGMRIFIEAGAGSNCARWIDEILKTGPSGEVYPHLALSMNRRGSDDYHNIVRILARLFSHRVPVNLKALYQPQGLKEWHEIRRASSEVLS
jgi:PfaB family protein